MALREYYCEPCRYRFEQLVFKNDPDEGKCPKCKGTQTRKLISKFAVGGQGDLRESTQHGCHGCHTGHHHHGHGGGDTHSDAGSDAGSGAGSADSRATSDSSASAAPGTGSSTE